jgi:dephospho-CoA kinase
MKVIGLVGGSGTGKSTIAAHLAARGAGLVDADRIAHEILDGDPEVVRLIRERFGEGVFTDGLVDRAKLGDVVFPDSNALEALGAIVHPRVLERCRLRLAEFESRGLELAVVDAALLLDVELPFRIDVVLALRASWDVQVKRLLEKGGVDRDDIVSRLESQSGLERSFDRADVVIDTARALDVVLAEVDRVVRELLRGDSGTRSA